MIKLINTTEKVSADALERARQGLRRLMAREDLGFFKVTGRDEIWSSSLRRAEQIRGKYDELVAVGIGGSSLGPKSLVAALESRAMNVHFLENVDGMAFERLMNGFKDLGRVHWLFISKSGGTLETLTLLDFVDQHVRKRGLVLEERSTVITEKTDNPLALWAEEKGVPSLVLDKDIGGRFSVLTPVGMLPAACAGQNVSAYREGARWALQNDDLVVQLTAQACESFRRQEWITAFWVYSSLFAEGGRWIQQLWAESLAKAVDRKGNPGPPVSVPLPLIGSVDQHSVLQQLSEGREKKFIWFIRCEEAETSGVRLAEGHFTQKTKMAGKPLGRLLGAFAGSTQQALRETGSPSLTLSLERLGEKELGAFLMTMMLVVGALGEVLDINAFDQPGVELGKKLVANYL